jgi:hypothetical protein
MNKRQVATLWTIAAALGAAIAIVKFSSKDDSTAATKRTAGQTLLESLPADRTSTLEITGADSSVTLQRKDGSWTVAQRGDYPADGAKIRELLRTLSELEVTRGMEAGPSFAPRFGMDESASKPEDRGITLTLKDQTGTELAKVSLGKSIASSREDSFMGGGMAVGRYVRNHADESGFYATNETFPVVTTAVPDWLSRDFIAVENILSVAVSLPGSAAPAWRMVRDTAEAEFRIEGASPEEVAATDATAPLKSLLSYARFDDVVTPGKLAEQADTPAKRTAVITTSDGFTYTLGITPVKGSPDKVLLTVDTKADLRKERTKPADEKPEDAKQRDSDFAARLKTLEEKLAKESKLAGHNFLTEKSSVESLFKERKDMVTKPQPAASPNTTGSVQQTPGGMVVTPPQPRSENYEAVSPAVRIPGPEAPAPEPKKE